MSQSEDGGLIPGKQVDKRYGICAKTRKRWQEDPKLKFPKATKIRNREFFVPTELDEFDRECAAMRAISVEQAA